MTASLISTQVLADLTPPLSPAEQDRLQQGQAIVTGSNGSYVGVVLVSAGVETAWDVLTDYESFANFLPNVSSSRVLETEGDRKVVERVDVRNVLLMNLESRICTESIENQPEQIDFRLVEGDHIKKLEGFWQIQPVEQSKPNAPQVLVSQTVAADADAGFLQGAFHGLFENSLEDSLNALRQEIERRSQSIH
ncbi:SRPBCC family protein [Oculatella sp. LEGE 06141]|uniref:SRPBCC family protein n=1 Tax=Oculatella sp. LEGE 06141 TaxID=1828648 RepID=UPI00187F1BD2|nr:SRPBCC family protein [Oculatella sp. LEGE 06141]MBE9177636.1 SRPBCC family protein [Oculatella sp. LEGE 06141]